MKKSTIAILSAVAIAVSHPNHGVNDVTSGESLLWLRSELNLEAEAYKSVSKQVKSFKEQIKSTRYKALKDSVYNEIKKEKPDTKKITSFNTEIGKEATQNMTTFSEHLLAIKGDMSEKQFARLLEIKGKVYFPSQKLKANTEDHSHKHDEKAHEHEHKHENGTVHKHGHEHGKNTEDHSHKH